jgi:hypothetical protein
VQIPLPANNPPTNIAFRISVVTAGSLLVAYAGSPNNSIILNYAVPGVYIEPGEFAYVELAEGSTLVTSPAASIVFLNK